MKTGIFRIIALLTFTLYFDSFSYAQKKEEDKVEFKNDKGNPSNGFAQGRHQVYYQGTLYGHWEPAKVENKVMSIEFDEKNMTEIPIIKKMIYRTVFKVICTIIVV